MKSSFISQLKDNGHWFLDSLWFSIKYLIYNKKYSKLHLI